MTAPRLKLFSFFILFLLLGSAHNATAQNPRGALRGTVQDISGGRLPGAKIILHNTELSLLRETLSDSRGEFRVPVPPIRGVLAFGYSADYRISDPMRRYSNLTETILETPGSCMVTP